MSIRINDIIPNLAVETDMGKFNLHDWIGEHWAILFSHPKDFTPVCTTEFSAVAKLQTQWAERNTKILGISVDSVDDHRAWKKDIYHYGNHEAFFPIISDTELTVSKAFDMLPSDAYLPDGRTPNDTQTVRSVFIIGPDKKLKLSMTYPMTVGRNFAEVVRALDALQLSTNKGVSTPADWQIGQDVIIPVAVNDEEAEKKFGQFEKVLPYIRKVNVS